MKKLKALTTALAKDFRTSEDVNPLSWMLTKRTVETALRAPSNH